MSPWKTAVFSSFSCLLLLRCSYAVIPVEHYGDDCITNWLQCAIETASFSDLRLRQPTGNYVNSSKDGSWTFCWDNFSQFGATVALAAQIAHNESARNFTCSLLGAAQGILEWQLQHLWRNDSIGGFFAAALSDGSYVDTTVQYTDDNALAGVILLESRVLLLQAPLSQFAGSSALAKQCLSVAKRCANWLIQPQSGAWDWQQGSTGGFWWNVSTQQQEEAPCQGVHMKPDNSASLAMLLFTQLWLLNEMDEALHWATTSASWMRSALYNSSVGLLNWYMDQSGGVNHAHFAYSNAIAARAHYLLGTNLGNDTLSQQGLQLLAQLDQTFWTALNSSPPSGDVVNLKCLTQAARTCQL